MLFVPKGGKAPPASAVVRPSLPCVVLGIFVLYGVFCYLFLMHPSPERILFVQTVTGTRLVEIGAFASEDPFLFDNLSPATRAILTNPELEALQVACHAAKAARVGQALLSSGTNASRAIDTAVAADLAKASNNAGAKTGGLSRVASSLTPNAGGGGNGGAGAAPTAGRKLIPSLAVKRFSAKLHLVCPLLLIFDYPTCFLIASGEAGLARLRFLTANFISLIHPICGLLAGMLFAKAVQSRSGMLLFGSATPVAVDASAEMGSTDSSTNPKLARTLSVPSFHAISMMEGSQGGGGGCGGGGIVGSSTGGGSSNGINTILGSVSPSSIAGGGGGGGTSVGPSLPAGSASHLEASVADVVGSPMSLLYDTDEGEAKDKEGHIALSPTSINFYMVRLGCVFFFLRGWLDTLDGVVFRLQRAYSGATGPIPTSFGFNGHSLDVVADAVGGFLACMGLLVFLFRRQVLLSRLLFSLLTTRFGISFRWMTGRGISVARCVAFAGLMVPAVAGSIWEFNMVRYSNLFDSHSPYNPQIFELERNFHVRLNMALWSLTYADTIFYSFIVAMFFDYIWAIVQFYAFVGYLWLAMVIAHSHYVWASVIYANPAARAILTQAAE